MSRRVAIIGAGIAGLRLGQLLRGRSLSVTVIDKARGPGGRISTRRSAAHQFDHGAPCFSVSGPELAAVVEDWLARGVVAEWKPKSVLLGPSGATADENPSPRYVGVPSMSAIARDLAEGLDVQCELRVASIQRGHGDWSVVLDDGRELGKFDLVFAATPAAQAISLVGSSPLLASSARTAEFHACHALMLAFAHPLEVDFDRATVVDSPIEWIAREASKPGRASSNAWVVHSRSDWSEEHLDLPLDRVQRVLLDALEALLPGPLPKVETAAVHRWLFARPIKSAQVAHAYDARLGLGLCGDWLQGDGIEAALRSAQSTAERVIDALTREP